MKYILHCYTHAYHQQVLVEHGIKTCERMCTLADSIYRKRSLGSITSTGVNELSLGDSVFGEWKVNNTKIYRTDENALTKDTAGYITLSQGPSYD